MFYVCFLLISGENEKSLLVKWNLETIQKSAELDTRKWNGHPFEIGWPVHSIRDCRLRIGVCLCLWVGVCDSSGFFVVLYKCKEETFKKKESIQFLQLFFAHESINHFWMFRKIICPSLAVSRLVFSFRCYAFCALRRMKLI